MATVMTKFFRFSSQEGSYRMPYAVATVVGQQHRNPCRKCTRFTDHCITELAVHLRARSQWPDIVKWGSSAGSGYLVSRKVIDEITAAGITGIDSIVQVEIQSLATGNKADSLPSYYSFETRPGLELDIGASEFEPNVVICTKCGQILDGGFISRRHVPIDESWNESDIFMLQRPHAGRLFLYCTRRVLELAREKQWKGFRFEPIDVERKYAVGWKEIDYLGKKWPPESWYPKRPSDGRSPRAWLEMYNSVRDGGKWYDAWKALLDLGDDALSLILEQLRSQDGDQRIRAACLLLAMDHCSAADVPQEALIQAQTICPLELQPPTNANLLRRQEDMKGVDDS